MGHAYLVAAHHQMQLLQILLHLIDDERNEIYLHVDKKCKEFKEEEFRQTVKKAKIHFIERRSVTWGGYSQIQLELDLLKEATNTYHDYYHLISGVDLPLKSQNEIYNFFEIHKGMQFVSYDYKMDVDDVTNRMAQYRLFQDLYGNKKKYFV
ncbi:MAG: beta-1,6-N-acetylglucosaminyltransferase [Lachnospiraceae bacterium]